MKVLVLLFLFYSIPTAEHDIQVATFKIHQKSSKIYLDINFDIEDLSNELKVEKSELSIDLLEKYLNQQTEFKLNEEKLLLGINDFEVKDDHLHIESEFAGKYNSIISLEITNTCFYENLDYSNIIEVRLNGQERDFLMNNIRTLIHVDL